VTANVIQRCRDFLLGKLPDQPEQFLELHTQLSRCTHRHQARWDFTVRGPAQGYAASNAAAVGPPTMCRQAAGQETIWGPHGMHTQTNRT